MKMIVKLLLKHLFTSAGKMSLKFKPLIIHHQHFSQQIENYVPGTLLLSMRLGSCVVSVT